MGQLNELLIKAAAPRDKEYLLADGEGLYLRVRPTGKVWVYRYKLHGKEAKLSIGHYPVVTLASARKKARAEAEKRADGVDPREARRVEEERGRVARLNTFELTARAWHAQAKKDREWSASYAEKVMRHLELHIFPWIGALAMEAIVPTEVVRCLHRIKERGNLETAQRVRELWQKRLLGGYDIDPAEALGDGFADERSDMVVIRGIAIHGVCPHHLVPFRGVAHVAYLPGGRLHGFGRIARLVDAIGHRFTYQEWMTRDIAEALMTHGKARGAACVIEAEQLCLLLGEDRRGDERVMTQAFTGDFSNSDQLRYEFLRGIGNASR